MRNTSLSSPKEYQIHQESASKDVREPLMVREEAGLPDIDRMMAQ